MNSTRTGETLEQSCFQKEAIRMELIELLSIVVDRGASDLHITVGVPPIIRVQGSLEPLDYPKLTPRDTKELIYSILTQEQRERLETNWEYDFSYSVPGKARFRVNAYYQRGSVSGAFRLIPVDIKSLAELNLPASLEELAKRPRGFILVTGPTGCGKTTTLATLMNIINESKRLHIMTIEDPIEFLHFHKKSVVNQREVGSDTKSFARALKYILRQDPDVILIGEMRDVETISAALTAAETGHLVFATLHTQDAPQTIDRVIDVFPPYQQQQIRVQLAGVLQGIVAQQLLPTRDGRARIPAVEILIPTAGVRNMIREMKVHQIYNAVQTGQKHGMQTMDQALADLVKQGKITVDTALSRAVDLGNLKQLIGKV